MTDVKDVPTEPLAPRSVPPQAIDALLRAAGAEQSAILRARDEALLALLIYAGLRVQEVCDLQLRDLDMGSGTVTIRSGKAGKARRVPLHPDAQRRLGRYLDVVRCPPSAVSRNVRSFWSGLMSPGRDSPPPQESHSGSRSELCCS